MFIFDKFMYVILSIFVLYLMYLTVQILNRFPEHIAFVAILFVILSMCLVVCVYGLFSRND